MASREDIDGSFFEGIGHYLQEFDQIQQSTGCSALGEEANGTNTIEIAMDRLEYEFRHVLEAYTCSNSNLTENESFTDSSSSTPSQFSFSISTNISVTENIFSDALAEEHILSEENQDAGISQSLQNLNFPCIISIPELAVIPIQSEAIYYFRCIAERMIASGSTQECVQAYCSIRRPMMDAIFLKLGTETLTTRQVQMLEWEILEKKIKRWIQAARFCFGVLFANEKMLLDRIFLGLSLDTTAVYKACFLETVMDPATRLLSFAEVVSTASCRSERLFTVLDVYEALSSLLPVIEITFEGRFLDSIRVQAGETLSKLAEMGRGILLGFEKSLFHEISNMPMPPGGGIHRLNRYVMDYLIFIASYKQLLVELIVSKPAPLELENICGDLIMDFVVLEGKSPLAVHLNLILGILVFKLDEKSKHFEKNGSLAHLFMLNNFHYMFLKIDGSQELREAMEMEDDDCLRKLKEKIGLSATNYQRSTWARVLYCLREKGLPVSGSFSSGTLKSALRERFKNFNAMFEEVHRTQATWLVPDIQLREKLQILISNNLIHAYRSFLGLFRSYIESGRHPENYIKYSAEDLENAVLDFFEGYPMSQHLKKRSQWNLIGKRAEKRQNSRRLQLIDRAQALSG